MIVLDLYDKTANVSLPFFMSATALSSVIIIILFKTNSKQFFLWGYFSSPSAKGHRTLVLHD